MWINVLLYEIHFQTQEFEAITSSCLPILYPSKSIFPARERSTLILIPRGRSGIWVCLIVYMPYPTTPEFYKVFIPWFINAKLFSTILGTCVHGLIFFHILKSHYLITTLSRHIKQFITEFCYESFDPYMEFITEFCYESFDPSGECNPKNF